MKQLTQEECTTVAESLDKRDPSSLIIQGVINGELRCNRGWYVFLVDSWPYYNVLIAKPSDFLHKENSYLANFFSHYYYFTRCEDKNIEELFRSTIDVSRNTVVCLFGEHRDLLEAYLTKHGTFEMIADCDMMGFDENNPSPLPAEPTVDELEGLKLESLSPDDAEFVNTTWKFGTAETHVLMEESINSLPSICLRHFSGDVIGHMITGQDMCLGRLYVRREDRRKGYGKVLLAALARKHLALGNPPFWFIEEGNVASMKLSRQIGARFLSKVSWVRFDPTNDVSYNNY
ncbi:unnamed protein product [Owenia fusiformis]|uniref:Glycine N-acyltransferase-like protein n=1 Tax=Owenia fusiformis TaxID=6347 RepID=A0A8J1YBS7_OWEFU|nr:unnamed protein product [Owenia fusiformis]